MRKAVVVYSGGVDSLTTLHTVLQSEDFDEVHAISVDYGQRHNIELQYAKKHAASLEIPHQVIDLSKLKSIMSNSALTDNKREMPHGHYAEDSMKQTVVPNRNAILISAAGAYAINVGASLVYIGAHAGDHYIYPDCRRPFIAAMAQALLEASEGSVNLIAPFLGKTKADIMAIGAGMGLDYTAAWTCYDPKQKGRGKVKRIIACGQCGACQERREAAAMSGAVDKMVYADD